VTFAAGDEPTAEQLNRLEPTWALKISDEIVNNSAALQPDDVLFGAVAASAGYLLRVHLVQQSGATPGFKLDITLPAGATWYPGKFLCGSSVANQQFGVMATAAISGITGAAANSIVDFEAAFVTSTTAGTAQLRWAQNTANVSDTIVRAGSWLHLERVA
jgi:hypothetical protein